MKPTTMDEPAAEPQAALSLALPGGITVGEAFTAIATQLGATIRRLVPHISAAAKNPEPVHQTRVAARRLRSAISIFRPAIASPEITALNSALRDLARALGPAREWDVFIAGTAARAAATLPDAPGLARFLAACGQRQKAAYRAIALPDVTLFMPTDSWQANLPEAQQTLLQAPLAPFAAEILSRRHRRVRRAGRHFASLETPALHELRLAGKRLRYASEFFAAQFPDARAEPDAATNYCRQLSRLQDRLGQINDDATIARLLAELPPAIAASFTAGAISGLAAGQAADAQSRAARAWRRFRQQPPFWL